jgi:hypothetical protein
MMIQGYHKGRTIKDVSFLDAANDSDESLIDAAIEHAGETRSSLFGWHVKRYDEGSAVVSLYTD